MRFTLFRVAQLTLLSDDQIDIVGDFLVLVVDGTHTLFHVLLDVGRVEQFFSRWTVVTVTAYECTFNQ